MTSTHTVPDNLDSWLRGWQPSRRTGNPYLRLPNGPLDRETLPRFGACFRLKSRPFGG
jgi:hypothetical protein